jgi:DNA-binding transcriptional MerR regulator
MARRELFTTADVARSCAVTPATVRYWAKTGYISPAVVTPSGQRLYTRVEIARVIASRYHDVSEQPPAA